MIDENTGDIFVVSFCCEGLEGVIPVSELERQDTFDLLKGNVAARKAGSAVNMMLLRARVNPQRYYEIYAITASTGITADDIKGLFEADPQYAADLIRERGQKLYSDRQVKDTRVIR